MNLVIHSTIVLIPLAAWFAVADPPSGDSTAADAADPASCADDTVAVANFIAASPATVAVPVADAVGALGSDAGIHSPIVSLQQRATEAAAAAAAATATRLTS